MSLPGLSVRKAEVEAVAEILTSDQYDSPEKMARAIVGQVMELFEERDWYMVAMQNESKNIVFGLYGTEGAATKSLEKNDLGLFGKCGVFEVYSASKRREFVADAMKPKEAGAPCVTCGHHKTCHGVRRADPGCYGCDARCREYEKPEK